MTFYEIKSAFTLHRKNNIGDYARPINSRHLVQHIVSEAERLRDVSDKKLWELHDSARVKERGRDYHIILAV